MVQYRVSCYKERLLVLNLESLEARRRESEIKMYFRFVNGLCDLDPSKLSSWATSSIFCYLRPCTV